MIGSSYGGYTLKLITLLTVIDSSSAVRQAVRQVVMTLAVIIWRAEALFLLCRILE